MFDIEALTHSISYVTISAGTYKNTLADSEEYIDDDEPGMDCEEDLFMMPIWSHANDDFLPNNGDPQPSYVNEKEGVADVHVDAQNNDNIESIGNSDSTARPNVSNAGPEIFTVEPNVEINTQE